MELRDINQRFDVIFAYYGPMRRPGLLGSFFGLTHEGYKTVSGWTMGKSQTSSVGLLCLGEDGEIYALKTPGRHEGHPISEADIQALHDAQEIKRMLHTLEERTDVFSKLRNRAES